MVIAAKAGLKSALERIIPRLGNSRIGSKSTDRWFSGFGCHANSTQVYDREISNIEL
jgi:hypothetical protein